MKISIDILLDERNFARGYLKDGKGLLLLFDSGATRSIISMSSVRNSQYLSALVPGKVNLVQFKLGNGECIHANTSH